MRRMVTPNGRWFDADTAVYWDENSAAYPDRLWRTLSGRFIFVSDGGVPTDDLFPDLDEDVNERESVTLTDAEFYTNEEAVSWLLVNGHDVPDDLARIVAELEL